VRIRRAILLALTLIGSSWSAFLTFAGGTAIQTPWGRLSSRDPVRPLGLAFLAAIAFACSPRATPRESPDAGRWPRRLAVAIALVACLGGIRFGTFTAGGSDPSGYVSEAALWRDGRLTRTAPAWVADAPWADAARTASPLGYRPGPSAGTQVPTYPPGLPLLMLLAHAVIGFNGEYFVVPLSAALLVWATYRLGARLSSPWGGVASASLIATSPPFLMWLVMPMGDVPVTAACTLALVCGLLGTTGGAAGAGAAMAVAILIRPNLVPLAAVVALAVACAATSGRRTRLLTYGATVMIGPLAVAALNWAVYGSPLESGYGYAISLFSPAFVWPNLERYTSWFVSAQTMIPLAGLLAPFVVRSRERRLIALTIVWGVPALILLLYLPYLPFDDWSYLRFLLPAYPPLFAGVSIVLADVAGRWGNRRWVRPVLALGVGLLALRGLDYSNAPTDLARTEPRYRTAALKVADVPAETVFVAFQHSGSLRYYTGRDILRWDLMDARSIDRAVEYLEQRGYRLLWVGDPAEASAMQQQLAGSRFLTRVAAGRTQRIDNVELVDLDAPR